MTTGKMPGDFIGKIKTYANCLGTINFYALGIAVISLAIIFLWPKINKKIPGSLVVIILATIVTTIFKFPVDTIGSRYGAIPSSLPAPTFPAFNISQIIDLFPTAVSIAVLAAIESLLSAVVAD